MGALPQQLVINEVAEEGAVGAAGFAHVASGKIYFPDITTSYAI
jgi:sugar (pentulose or hexulose) kinase